MEAVVKKGYLAKFLDLENATVLMGEPDDLEFLEECFELFRSKSQSEVGHYLNWVSTQESQIKKSAHALKSTSAALGASRISELFSACELKPQDELIEELKSALDELFVLWDGYRAEIHPHD